MLAEERQARLLGRLRRWGSIRTTAAATELGVSSKTVHRDLVDLEARGLLRRTHGGALPVRGPGRGTGPRVGVLMPTDDYYYAAVIDGVQRAVTDHGATVIIATHAYSEALETSRVRRLAELDLDGVLATVTPDTEAYRRLGESGLAAVVIERPRTVAGSALPSVDHVHTDHAAGAVLAVDHLAGLGHRRIRALLRDTPTVPALRDGLRRAEAAHGLEVEVHVFPNGTVDSGPRRDALITGLLADHGSGGPTAAVVHSDPDADALRAAAMTADIAVPEALSIISYDDVVAGELAVPLTAVAPRRDWLGRCAADLVLARLGLAGGVARDRPPLQVSLEPVLHDRGSTGPPPR